jgi:hypothetical protein
VADVWVEQCLANGLGNHNRAGAKQVLPLFHFLSLPCYTMLYYSFRLPWKLIFVKGDIRKSCNRLNSGKLGRFLVFLAFVRKFFLPYV